MKAVFKELLRPLAVSLPKILDLYENRRLSGRMTERVVHLPSPDLEFGGYDVNIEDRPAKFVQNAFYDAMADLGLTAEAARRDVLLQVLDDRGKFFGRSQGFGSRRKSISAGSVYNELNLWVRETLGKGKGGGGDGQDARTRKPIRTSGALARRKSASLAPRFSCRFRRGISWGRGDGAPRQPVYSHKGYASSTESTQILLDSVRILSLSVHNSHRSGRLKEGVA